MSKMLKIKGHGTTYSISCDKDSIVAKAILTMNEKHPGMIDTIAEWLYDGWGIDSQMPLPPLAIAQSLLYEAGDQDEMMKRQVDLVKDGTLISWNSETGKPIDNREGTRAEILGNLHWANSLRDSAILIMQTVLTNAFSSKNKTETSIRQYEPILSDLPDPSEFERVDGKWVHRTV